MTMIKSPYNFVPAPTESEVYKPDWADLISHDVPFEDGESGEIAVTITAETPIFIRNGHAKPGEGEQVTSEFSHVEVNGEKKYFIPATSIKGMLRNVLEILSFSRLKQVADDRYSFRDLTKDSLYMSTYKSSEVKAGWLFEDFQGNWQIEECENFALISHFELANQPFDLPFRRLFLNRNPENKTAKSKYDLLRDRSLTYRFKTTPDNFNKLHAEYSTDGVEGTLVFTGQSSKRKEEANAKNSGKLNEFVFFNSPNPKTIIVTEKQKKDFKFIYLEHDSQNISEDWKYWKDRLERGSVVPVFFTPDGVDKVKHFGLAFMYKLPYSKSIHETNPIKEYKDKIKTIVDLPDLIFGNTTQTNDNKSNSLKGRVFISNASSNNANELEERMEILGSPKASFVPFYLNQPKENGDLYTYQDKGANLKGFKRYLTQDPSKLNSFGSRYTDEQISNPRVFSRFKPIDKGAVFDFKIRFHNLKKAEVGALLSALTFHGNEESVYHNIGMAKPFGYGKIKISEINLRELKFDKIEYLASFEDLIGYEKLKSDRIKKLFLFASSNEVLTYPKLTKNLDEFKIIKKNKEYLSNPEVSNIKVKSFNQLLQNKTLITNSVISGQNPFAHCLSFKELRNEIRNQFNDDVSGLHSFIIETIKNVFDEKETKKTFRDKQFSENPWQIPIAQNWLGQDKAKKLYNDLNP